MSRTRKNNPEYNNRNPYAEDARNRKAGPMKSKGRQNKNDWQDDWQDEILSEDKEFNDIMNLLSEDSEPSDTEFSDKI